MRNKLWLITTISKLTDRNSEFNAIILRVKKPILEPNYSLLLIINGMNYNKSSKHDSFQFLSHANWLNICCYNNAACPIHSRGQIEFPKALVLQVDAAERKGKILNEMVIYRVLFTEFKAFSSAPRTRMSRSLVAQLFHD